LLEKSKIIMNGAISISMGFSDWLVLLQNFLIFSMAAMGGPLILLPEMRRFLVVDQGWLTDDQVSASVVIAQASPGPNALFIALFGWNVGVNAGGIWLALLGATICLLGSLIPSCALIYATAHWVHRNSHRMFVKAFKQGMSPVVVSLLICSGWTLGTAGTTWQHDWPMWLLTLVTTGIVGRLHMFWLLAIGGVLGATGVLSVG
jgi:chromate transporter